jgi:uncharacterized phage-like protein YoqJ
MNSRNYIVSFTGHRNYNNSADDKLRETVTSLYNIGARIFRVGMAEGFDMVAAEIVMELMSENSDITMEAYIPWPEFDKRLNASDAVRFRKILSCCDRRHIASEEYNKGVFHKRNDMLIDGADYIVAWWNGSSSGTGYTVKRARRNHIRIINLYPSAQMLLQL